MENFEDFKLNNSEMIFGGEIERTYVAINGDVYDTDSKQYYFFE